MIVNFDKKYNITPEDILSKVNEIDIYEFYSKQSIEKDKSIKCCFPSHEDKTPSLKFYRTNNNLKFKCFGCGKQGGVFNFVQEMYNISFIDTMNLIANDFKINNIQYNINIPKVDIVLEEKLETQIIPTYQSFTKIDYNYWKQYYIPLDLLYEFDGRSCKKIEIITKHGEYILWGEYYNANPIYSYKINNHFKGYRPLSPTKEGKWINNTKRDDIQGLKQLKSKENLILTSSLKDVIVLKILGYNAIALNSESQIPDIEVSYIFYDNDKAGIEYAKKLKRPFIHIPLEYKEKDISDFVKTYGIDKGKKLMSELMNE